MSKFSKALASIASAVALGVAGNYVYDLIKGTAPSSIGEVLWRPFGVVIGWVGSGFSWLAAPARLSHLDVLLFAFTLIALGVLTRRRARELDHQTRSYFVDLNQRLLRIERRTEINGADLETPAESADEPPPAQAITAPPVVITGPLTEDLARFHEERRKLEGRFAEWEAYCKSVVGLSVRWLVEVRMVSTQTDRTIQVLLGLVGQPYGTAAIAWYPQSFRDRIYALRTGEHIYVIGTIEYVTLSMPRLTGKDIEVVLPNEVQQRS